MVSIAEQSFNMLPRHDDDFTLYPDPPQTFSSAPMDLGITADAFGFHQRNAAHDNFPTAMGGFDSVAMFADGASQYGVYNNGQNGRSSPYADEGEMRVPSSNLSTASAPSAASSAVGSPQSHHGQLAPIPDWAAPQGGLGVVTPGIVGQTDYFHTGTEYSTEYAISGAPGMDDYTAAAAAVAFDYPPTKPGFVGELTHTAIISSAAPRFSRLHHSGSFSSSVSQESASTLILGGDAASAAGSTSPGLAVDTHAQQQPPASPVSAASRKSSISFTSPVSNSFSPSAAAVAAAQPWGTPSPQTPRVSPFFSQSSGHFIAPLGSSYPSLIHPDISRPMGMPYDGAFPQPGYPNSPSLSSSPQPMMRGGSQSPFLHGGPYQQPYGSPYQPPVDHAPRQPSIVSPYPSNYSGDNHYSGDESKEKQRCPHQDCGKTFKDLKAHMLTHQNERPEKCPIQTCDYHIKGFARKYDKNRHTLTHYKGTMVCGFCPGSGSAAEKSFNRADVFKRHLTAVHGVEQTPPNSRKKTVTGAGLSGLGKKLAGYPPDATGKCSTCSQTFGNAQDFYEHLDDCVLRIVQQEDPAEAINAQRLAEVEHDKDVHQTLEKNHLPLTTQTTSTDEADEDEDMGGLVDDDEDDSADEDAAGRRSNASPKKKHSNPAGGVQKSRGLTHSRGGVALPTKNRGRKNRRDYPSSWGFDKGQMTMKKRVMAVFDGQRRLAKDDMMLSTEHEVRVRLADGKSYVTDLDVQTMKRAEGFLGATDEEKGPWVSDDPTEEQVQEMLERSKVAQ